MDRIELLAPARDLECGRVAVDCGADAVYIGAPRFGARENAGNPLEAIAELARYTHRYWARVYATVNTLLRDEEIPLARQLAWRLYDLGIDGLIIQDIGLLECDLPPVPLIASTQMHNATSEKVAFLEQVGFHRVILARELELVQIRAIRRAVPRIELECFAHGALCVGYSGQCYLSYALGGRSGNRGQCAQPCRKSYTLTDVTGRVLETERHLLSLRDLNRSDHLAELIRAGVCSFKIEGRLKDKTYVANVVAHYRRRLDSVLAELGLQKSSSGAVQIDFTPDPDKTFNRGYTSYFLHGRGEPIGSIDTPKMVGAHIGRVLAVNGNSVTLDAQTPMHPGDGICFFDRRRRLRGTTVNAARGRTMVPDKLEGIEKGIWIYRNHDHAFLMRIQKSRRDRRIAVALTLREIPDGLLLAAIDEDGVRAEFALHRQWEAAEKSESALNAICRQLAKTGDTVYACSSVSVEMSVICFLPLSVLNELRREVLEKLSSAREAARPKVSGGIIPNEVPYPEEELSYQGNVLNRYAESFYRRHGVKRIEPAAESGLDMRGRKVMTSRYCLKHQLGLCPMDGSPSAFVEPLFLIDEEGRRLRLHFDCEACEMEIYLDGMVSKKTE